METMSDRIKRLRIECGLTQQELGDKLGIQKAAVYKYESGLVENMKRSTIQKMSEILGVTPSYLMVWGEEEALSLEILNEENKKIIRNIYNELLIKQEEEEPLSPNEYELPVAHIKNDSINMPMWMDDVTDDFIAVSKIVVNYAKMIGNFHFSGGFDIQEMTDEMLVERANNLLQKQEFVERLENQKLIKKGNNYYVQLQQESKGSN